MVTFLMIFIDPVFEVTAFLKSNLSKNGASYGQSCYRTVIGNHTSIECTTFNDLE